ncbi:MAG: VWA domain-containing protein [Clostridia bacterium]|nr:VWA domain-containing protein [Clostridia bacterium]
MFNFTINFERPWFLLLIIPAIAFTLIPYFLSNKKYRRNRNRIVSIVLHMTAILLSITVLAGIDFQYDVPNKENEVIILVDKSNSNEASDTLKDDFVRDVIMDAYDDFKLGVVTFGYNQVLAAPISDNTDEVLRNYLTAEAPDDTATDIASALTYAQSLFTKPESARIVLLSDGVETDSEALRVIKNVAASGIKVDTVHFPDEHGDEVQIISSTLPEHTLRHGEAFEVKLELESSYEGVATISVFDNATIIGEPREIRLSRGVQEIKLDVVFPLPGLHKLNFEIESAGDTLTENNSFNTYVNIEVFDKILIIESIANESESLRGIMTDKKVTVVNSYDVDKMPKTVDELRAYDEVVLVNVANADLPDGFDAILYSYVKDIGGGLFTVCGNKEDSNPSDSIFEANAWTREDMYGSLYQELLPVEVINYTPPVAVVFVIDTSGSMYMPPEQGGSTPFEKSRLYAAQQGVLNCLSNGVLTERDWMGIMTFAKDYSEDLELTPCTQRDKIESAIDDLPRGGGETIFTSALERAGSALTALTDVEKRHIILVTDGAPTDDEEDYAAAMKRNAALGITMSIIGIETEGADDHMRYILENYAATETNGVSADNYHDVEKISDTAKAMREDLQVPEIKDVNYETFRPTIKTHNSVVNGINNQDIPTLDGFYGTMLKDGAEAVLMGEFVPIYAQWKFGKGTVGSFMCDLNGNWSSAFINDAVGKTLVNNMVASLFPTESIRTTDIDLSLKEENYTNRLNIYTDVAEGELIEVVVNPTFADAEPMTLYPSAADGFGRVSFVITKPGIYEITVSKKTEDGRLISSNTICKAFSYSKEYDMFFDSEEKADFLSQLAADGQGFVLTEPSQVFENVVKSIHKVIDPRIVFIIIALIAFLLDVAVRKFKFKWIHEIIRDHRAKEKK